MAAALAADRAEEDLEAAHEVAASVAVDSEARVALTARISTAPIFTARAFGGLAFTAHITVAAALAVCWA